MVYWNQVPDLTTLCIGLQKGDSILNRNHLCKSAKDKERGYPPIRLSYPNVLSICIHVVSLAHVSPKSGVLSGKFWGLISTSHMHPTGRPVRAGIKMPHPIKCSRSSERFGPANFTSFHYHYSGSWKRSNWCFMYFYVNYKDLIKDGDQVSFYTYNDIYIIYKILSDVGHCWTNLGFQVGQGSNVPKPSGIHHHHGVLLGPDLGGGCVWWLDHELHGSKWTDRECGGHPSQIQRCGKSELWLEMMKMMTLDGFETYNRVSHVISVVVFGRCHHVEEVKVSSDRWSDAVLPESQNAFRFASYLELS